MPRGHTSTIAGRLNRRNKKQHAGTTLLVSLATPLPLPSALCLRKFATTWRRLPTNSMTICRRLLSSPPSNSGKGSKPFPISLPCSHGNGNRGRPSALCGPGFHHRTILLSNGIERIIRKAKENHETCKDAATDALRDLGLENYNS